MRRGHFCYFEGRRCYRGAGRAPLTNRRIRDLVPKEQFASTDAAARRGISIAPPPGARVRCTTKRRRSMFGKRFNVAVTIALVALLFPRTGAASEKPTLLSHVTSPPVRDMPPQAHHGGELEEKERHRPPHR